MSGILHDGEFRGGVKSPLYLALDVDVLSSGLHLVEAVHPYLGGVKVGMEFFYAFGAQGYEAVGQFGLPIFLDLKLHDIPNTVARGISSLLSLSPVPSWITVHTAGGEEMLRAAKQAAGGRCRILGVTVLTSLAASDISGISLEELVLERARLAHLCGLDGVVASAFDVPSIKAACGPDFITVVPGLRMSGAASHDQKRVATPEEALAGGADLLVVGRAVTQAENPEQVANAFYQASCQHHALGKS